MEKKTYKDIYSLLDRTLDEQDAKKLKSRLKARELSRRLFCIRKMKGLSQEEVANRLKKTVEYVDNLENEIIDNISIKELMDYAKACDVDLEIFFSSNSNRISDNIKFHSKELLNLFTILGKMCKEDSQMLEGAFKIKIEALFNPIMCTLNTALELIDTSMDKESKREVYF